MNLTRNPFRLRGILGNVAAAAVMVLIGLPAAAAEAGKRELSEEQRARFEARIEEARSRLELTEAQKTQLEPVLRKDFERRIEILRKHGVTRETEARPTRSEARALRADLKALRDETEAEVDGILDDRQMDEYRKIQDEARQAMREQMRSRREEGRQ